MPVINLTSLSFTDDRNFLSALKELYKVQILRDPDLIETAFNVHGISKDLMDKVLLGHPIPFNNFSHDREKAIAALKMTLAGFVDRGNVIFSGIIGHLIPGTVSRVLHILVTQKKEDRIKNALHIRKSPDLASAAAMVEEADRTMEQWGLQIRNRSVFDPDLYTITLPLENPSSGIEEIRNTLAQAPFSDPPAGEESDFTLSAQTHMALADLGRGLIVSADQGHVIITIDKKQRDLKKTQSKIMERVRAIEGVCSVKTKIGPNYYRGAMHKNFDLGP